MGAVTDRLFPALTSLEFAQLQATREADAAARGLFDAGADQVIVWDNHNGSQKTSAAIFWIRAVRSLSEWDSSIVGPG